MPNFSNLIAYARYNFLTDQRFHIDHIRDGGDPTIATGGSPAIISGSHFGAGALELIASGVAEWLDYDGSDVVDAAIDAGCIEFFVKPNYSGTPAGSQYFAIIGNDGNLQNGVEIYHDTSGNLNGILYHRTGSIIASIAGAFSPDGISYYHAALSWDDSDIRLFVDGSQIDSASSAGGRSSAISLLRLGCALNDTTLQPDFVLDDLRIYDAHVRTGAFTPPSAELRLAEQIDYLSLSEELVDTKTAYVIKTGVK